MTEETVIVSNDNCNVIMSKTGTETTFRLTMKVENRCIDLKKVLGANLYDLMAATNEDLIEKLVYIKKPVDDKDYCDGLIVLKKIGSDFGIKQKYLCLRINVYSDLNKRSYESILIKCPDELKPLDCEPVKKSYGIVEINYIGMHKAEVVYDFSLELEDNMPIFLEKLPGKLMAKIFTRVKVFIENFKV
jgi:hypothetical protein